MSLGSSALRARTALSVVVLLALLTGVALLFVSPRLAERLVFFPSRVDPGDAPSLAGVRGEDVFLETSDGVRIHGWWHAAGPGTPAVLLLHGNAGTIALRSPLAEGYLERGISVFLLDYRGYGRSEGRPTEEGIRRDAEAALAFVADRASGTQGVVVHGRSVGGAASARLVRDHGAAGLILDAAFTSLDRIAASVYPFLPAFLFRRLEGHFDTLAAVREITAPLLVVHGTEDRIVPPEMGRALREAASGPAELYSVPGAGHDDIHWIGGDEYFDRLSEFVRRATGRPASGNGPAPR